MNDEEYVAEWLQFAKHDSDTAAYLLDNMRNPPLEIICFHCQQAAEKSLKGLLTAKGLSFERKHDLSYLLDLLSYASPCDTVLYNACARLTPYGTAVRYPGIKEISMDDAKRAVSNMHRIERWVKKEFERMKC